MKQPKKPYQPTSPYKPTQKYMQPTEIPLDNLNSYRGGEIKLSKLIAELPDGISPNDAFLCVEVNCDMYSGDSNHIIYIRYYKEVDNLNYDYQMILYDKELKKYKKKLEKYKPKLEAYNKEREKYDEWFRENLKERRLQLKNQEIARLKKKLTKLEKRVNKNG